MESKLQPPSLVILVNGTAILVIFSAAHFYRIEVRYQCALSASVDKPNDEFAINAREKSDDNKQQQTSEKDIGSFT